MPLFFPGLAAFALRFPSCPLSPFTWLLCSLVKVEQARTSTPQRKWWVAGYHMKEANGWSRGQRSQRASGAVGWPVTEELKWRTQLFSQLDYSCLVSFAVQYHAQGMLELSQTQSGVCGGRLTRLISIKDRAQHAGKSKVNCGNPVFPFFGALYSTHILCVALFI